MSHSLKIVLLVFSLLLLAIPPCNDLRSCYYGPEWDDTRALFFEPGIAAPEGVEPFFFTPHTFHLRSDNGIDWSGMRDTGLLNADYRRNCSEWRQYLGKEIPLPDIYKVIYGENPDAFLNAYEMDSLRQNFPGNAFIEKMQSPQRRPVLEYLAFSKRLEFQQNAGGDPWDFQEENTGAWSLDSLSQLAKKSLQTTQNDPFLKQRWAYQRLTCQFYQADSTFIQTFRDHFTIQDKSILMPWALIKVAEAQGDAEGNYTLSKVFELCQSKRTLAILRFISADAEKSLPYAKNDLERAGVIAMRAMQNPGRGLSDLKKISEFSLQSPYLPLLITREINKLEDWVLTQPLTGYYNVDHPEFEYNDNYYKRVSNWNRKNIEKDKLYLGEFNNWLQALDQNQAPANLRECVRLSVAHLFWMQNNVRSAAYWLSRVKSEDPGFQLQKDVESLLLLPLQADVNQLETQENLANMLLKIRGKTKQMSFSDKRLGRIYLYLSQKFYQSSNIPLAGLFFNRSLISTGTSRHNGSSFYESIQFFDNLASVKDIDTLLNIVDKKQPSRLEKFLTAPYSPEESQGNFWYLSDEADQFLPVPPRSVFLDLQGTIAFREGDFNKANACFQQISPSYWRNTFEYASYLSADFFGSVDSLPFSQLQPDSGGKASFVKKLLALEKEAAENPSKRAENYFLIGNAHYEATTWGRAWMMFCYGKGWTQFDTYTKTAPNNLSYAIDSKRYGSIYERCSRAIPYYERCLKSQPNQELASKAAYMLATCKNNVLQANGEGGDVRQPKAFKNWGKQYRNTQTYTKILEECPILRDYFR